MKNSGHSAALRIALVGTAALIAGTAFAADKVAVGNAMKEFPESVTSTADGTLYVPSLTMGTIMKAAPGATSTAAFIPAQTEGPSAVLGVLADEAHGLLWACYADLAAFSGQPAKPSVLRAFDLASGSVKASYTFPEMSVCNDITVAPDGTAYAADTSGARIIRVDPGSDTADVMFTDPLLGGVDGLSLDANGTLYVNNVMTNKLYRLEMDDDGDEGTLTEIAVTPALQGPDGMRFGDDGKLYVAENAAGQASELTISGDTATSKPVATGYIAPTAVTKVGNTLWVLEAKINMFGGTEDPGQFYVHPVTLGGM